MILITIIIFIIMESSPAAASLHPSGAQTAARQPPPHSRTATSLANAFAVVRLQQIQELHL